MATKAVWQWLPKVKLVLAFCWFMPIFALAGAGLYWLWQTQWWWPFLLVTTALTFSSYLIHFLYQKKAKLSENKESVSRADQAWSTREQEVWEAQMAWLDDQPELEWSALYQGAFAQFKRISEVYFPDNSRAVYAFTLPELLQINEEVSRRYRHYVESSLPMAREVRIDQIIALYSHKSQVQTGWKWASNTYRVARWVNPFSAILGEIRGVVFNRAMDEAGSHLQYRAKRLLLEQASAVAIDLYSGRWQLSEAPSTPLASDVQPSTVCLMGQINAGKSSLINQLLNETVAESGVLPTTDETVGYQFDYDANTRVIYQDSPGVTLSELSSRLNDAVKSDFIVWVVKATQSARQVDVSFFRALNDFYAANPSRQCPPVVIAITHIDQLGPEEPLERLMLENPTTPKAQMVSDLINHLKVTLPLKEEVIWIPLCSQMPNVHNIDALEMAVVANLDEAATVQLNRRRQDKKSIQWEKEWKRVLSLGKVLASETIIKSASSVIDGNSSKK